MGFYITKLKDTELKEYIGSQTMYSCADNGAFDTEVDKELEKYANETDGIFAVVDKSGVCNFLNTLKSGKCKGRDVEKFIKTVEENYMDGFMMRG
jgi:hypothetical protein